MKKCICGEFEEYCYDKFEEYIDKGGALNVAKAYAFGMLRGIPTGLVGCGILLYALGISARIQGKKIGLVDKD